MPFFKTKSGFDVSYELIPNVLPQTTVFVHGNLASNRWWYPAEQEFRKTAKSKNYSGSMLLIEFLGCGKSSAPKTEHDVNMKAFAADFCALVSSLNLGKVNVVGHSTGGVIAALMLAGSPELFHKSIFLDPVGAHGVKFDDAMIGAFEAMKSDRQLTATVMASTIYKNDEASDFFQKVVIEDAFHAVKTVGHWVLKALDGLDITKEVKSIQHPVLVLHGEFDVLLPVKDSEEMASLMSHAKFQSIKGQGHCTNAENPGLFVELTHQFLFS